MEKRMKPGQRVIVALRNMIASGELADGERIAEIPTAERLGVSRMPVRTALRTLEQEGLVTRIGARGYAARGPTMGQVTDAIEVRGVLEGLAARIVASTPAPPALARKLELCLAQGETLFAKGHLEEADLERFYAYNCAFHDLLVAASDNAAIAYALSRNNHLPFGSAAALALDWEDMPATYDQLSAAHREHVAVCNAILAGKAEEAEQLMRQHARAPLANGRLALAPIL
ncbi:GntR family transcriptional regulator [Blastomonas fulva]|uniref:GntR family transcriptional regulator n=1 Tax=Blastomonas fulva TaxID=1550728 RepID=UPI003F71544E